MSNWDFKYVPLNLAFDIVLKDLHENTVKILFSSQISSDMLLWYEL
jgi:hypothetical protein